MSLAYSRIKRRELKKLRKARRAFQDHEGPWTSKHAKAKRLRFEAKVKQRRNRGHA